LARDGSSTDKCLAVRANTIEAGEASLLTGCLPEEHLHYSRTDKVEAESLLDVICKSGRSVLVVDGSGGKLQGFARGQEEYVRIDSKQPDSKVMEKAIGLFLEKKPFLTYIYLDDCKISATRVNTKDHLNHLRDVDLEIGKLVKVLKNWNIYGETCLIVTAARSSSTSNMVPLIVKSSGIKADSQLHGVNVIDVAPTICALAGLEPPHNSSGVVIWDAFVPGEKYGAETLIKRQMEELQRERVRVWTRLYQIMKERDSLSHQIEEIKEEQENIFEYAGQNEQTIAHLRKRLNWSKGLMAGMIMVFLSGYVIEYRWLKRRFMLFK
ncbi:MAG: hypothetical protein ACM3UW_05280, partial [Bacillota bacterium]